MMASMHFSTGKLTRLRVPMLLAAVTALVIACGGDDVDDADTGTDTVEESDDADADAADADDADAAAEEPAADAGDWPEDDIRLIIPTDVGGGLDTASRTFEQFWEAELGVNLNIDHLPGANFAIGLETAANAGEECDTIVTKAIPHLLYSYLTQDVDFTYDDFYPIGSSQVQPAGIVVSADSDYETIDDLIADIEARPGEVRASVSGLANNNYAGLVQMEELLGVDINVVGYDGGGPARNAILSGEVEFTHAAIFATLPIIDEIRFLAIHQEENQWEELTGEIPTLNEATGEDFGSNSSTYGVFVNRACYEDYPERHQVLVDTFSAMLENEEYQATLEEQEALDSMNVISPEDYDEQIRNDIDVTQQTIDSSDEL